MDSFIQPTTVAIAFVAVAAVAIIALGPEWSCIFCRMTGYGDSTKHRCILHNLVMSTTGDDTDDDPDGIRILANDNAPPAQDPPCALARAVLVAEAAPLRAVAALLAADPAPMEALVAALGRRAIDPVPNGEAVALLVGWGEAAEQLPFRRVPPEQLPVRRVPRLGFRNRLLARIMTDDEWAAQQQPDQPNDDVQLRALVQQLLHAAEPEPFAAPMLTLHHVRAMVFTHAELYPLYERAAWIQVEMGIPGVKEGHSNCQTCSTGIYNMEIRRRLIMSGELRHGLISREDAAPITIPSVEENEAAEKELVCSICLHDFEKKADLISKTKCGHYYHVDCISQWINIQRKCPNCVRKLE